MKKISDFDQTSQEQSKTRKETVKGSSHMSSERLDSLEGLLSDKSFDSFRKFRDDLIERLQQSADKELSASVECLSNTSEVFSVYKGLESDCKSWNIEKMVDQKGNQIDFVDLFIHRYKQVCKSRKRVRESDLRQYTQHLEANFAQRRRPQGITNFDSIFHF